MHNSTRILIALCLGSSTVPLAMSTAAYAQSAGQSGVAVVGKPFYESSGHKALSVVTIRPSKDLSQKLAGLILEFEKSDEHYQYNGTYGKQIVIFTSAAEWKKFLAAWREASALPLADNYFKDSSYFDGDTMVDIGKDSKGNMSFTMAGNPDTNNIPQDLNMFDLPLKDVAAFNSVLKTVSLYFNK